MATTFLSLTARTELPVSLAAVWNTVALDSYATVPVGATHVLLETYWPTSATGCTYGFQSGDDYTNYIYTSSTKLCRFDWIPINVAKTLRIYCNYASTNLKYFVRAYSNHIKSVIPVDISGQITNANITTVSCAALPADAAGGAAIIQWDGGQAQFINPNSWGSGKWLEHLNKQQEIVPLDVNKTFQLRQQSASGLTAGKMVIIGYIPAGRFIPNTSLAIEPVSAIGAWTDTVTQLSPEKVLDVYMYRGNSTANVFGFATGGDTAASIGFNPKNNPLYIIPNATTGAASFYAGTSNTDTSSYRVGGFVASYTEKTIGTTDTVAPGTSLNVLNAPTLLTLTSLTIGGMLTNSYVGQDGKFTFRMPRRQDGQTYPAYGTVALEATNTLATLSTNVDLVPQSTETTVTISDVSTATAGYLKNLYPSLAVGDVVAYKTPTALAVSTNSIAADGLITTNFVGSQVIWIRNSTTGVMSKVVYVTDALNTTPTVFNLQRQTNVALGSEIISNVITVAGVVGSVPVGIVGGTYSKNSGAYTSTGGTVVNGDTITVKVTASASVLTAVEATLTVGSLSDTFTAVTTATGPADLTPNPIIFPTVGRGTISTIYTSEAVVVSGIDAASPISISIVGGTYSKNGGAYTSTAGTVVLGDTVTVRVTSSPNFATSAVATLTVGSVTGTYTVTTLPSTSNILIGTWTSNTASPKFDGLFINGGH